MTTPTGSGYKWTFSAWVKRAVLGTNQNIFEGYTASSDAGAGILQFNTSDQLLFGGWATTWRITTAVYRDPSAWYHIVLAVDTTQGTAADRIKLYVNGSEVTAFGTSNNPTQNTTVGIDTAGAHQLGRRMLASSNDYYSNMYLAEVHFVDGTALTPSTFGQTDGTTGQWVPQQVTGVTYGANGFYLSFSDNSGTTSTTLGKDSAGSNNWTPNNFSVTAGAGNDSLTDTPTNNYCVFCPVAKDADVSLSNGGLEFSCTSGGLGGAIGTFAPPSGKWYWEVTPTSGAGATAIGIAKLPLSAYDASQTGTYLYLSGGNKRLSPSTDSAYGASFTDNDVIGVALDMDAGTVVFYKNNVSQGTAFSSLSGDFSAWVQDGSGATATTTNVNFGQRPFAYTPPTGFLALCTANLPTPSIVKPNQYFDIDTYTSNGSGRTKTGLGFQPDLAWFKGRSGATDHGIYDSARGVQKDWGSNLSTDETTQSTGLTAFTSDGYTIGTLAKLNTNAATYASWLWKEGITPGLDIVTYTGAGAGTVAHNLGVVPKFIIVKARTTAGTDQTAKVYHASLANTEAMDLGATSAKATGSSLWNSATPTASVFSVGSTNATSGDTYVAYVFAEVAGFSRFGSYAGNSSTDGPFVHCGFRPRYVLIKRVTTGGNNWRIYDTARSTYNTMEHHLYANDAALEDTSGGADDQIDCLANGFKLRTSGAAENNSGDTYIFAAFAEAPFKYALAR